MNLDDLWLTQFTVYTKIGIAKNLTKGQFT